MADTTSIIKYYQDTLLEQWVNATRARGTIGLLVDGPISDLVILDVRDAFDIETAVGPQLDVIGQYVGFSRTIFAQIVRPYFQLPDCTTYDPGTPAVGLTDSSDPTVNPDSVIYRDSYASESFAQLDDEEYRFMLKLKIILNSCDNTLYGIANILYSSFGNDIVAVDSADMTMGYYVGKNVGRFTMLAISQKLLPKPMGITLSGVFSVPDPFNVWGFQSSSSPNSNTNGFSDSTVGWSGQYWLQSTDKI